MEGLQRLIEGFRLSPQQKRIWRLQQDSQAYNAQCAILIEGDLKPKALEAALNKMMRKHEILRTVLDWFPGLETPIQIVLENPPLPSRNVDLSDYQPEYLEAVIDNYFRDESRAFDLKRGLLTRFCLGRLSASRQVLLISAHSICADSWTLRNMFREVSRFYAAELEGRELSDEPTQYLQFSEWLNELLEEGGEAPEGSSLNVNHSDLALPL